MTWFPTTTRGWLIFAALTPLLVGPWVALYFFRQQPTSEALEELLCAGPSPSRVAREEKMGTEKLGQACQDIDADARATEDQRHAAFERRWSPAGGHQ
jgi:RsiW-degrading membrane proteinase PrsW (M82 family)